MADRLKGAGAHTPTLRVAVIEQPSLEAPAPAARRFFLPNPDRSTPCSAASGNRTLIGPSYFVSIALRGGALGVGAAGEITNVTQVFQPSGRFFPPNSP